MYIGSFVKQVVKAVQLAAGVLLEKEAIGIHHGVVPDSRLPLGSHVFGPLNWKGACTKAATNLMVRGVINMECLQSLA